MASHCKRRLQASQSSFLRIPSNAIVNSRSFPQSKAGRVHLNGHLSPTRLNRLGQVAFASPIQKRLLRRLLPYA